MPSSPTVPAGTQWHPEKPTSEFGMVEVPHTLDAVRASQHLANVFIDTGGQCLVAAAAAAAVSGS